MKNAARILVASTLFGFMSCASPQVIVEVRTSPVGAKIYVNGHRIGPSPRRVTFDFDVAERNLLQFVYPDYPVVESGYTRAQLPQDDEPIYIKIPSR